MPGDAISHAKVVLSAIIPGRRDLLDVALRQLQEEHFVEPLHANMFKLLEAYLEQAQAVLPRSVLVDMLRGSADPAKVLLYEELYDSFAVAQVADSDFNWSVKQLRELDAERRTLEALTEGAEILRNGIRDRRGNELRGPADARAQVTTRFAEIERVLQAQDAPEGNVRHEANDILADYTKRAVAARSGASVGIRFGIPDLDHIVGGQQPGEMSLIGGFSSDGKSSFCAQYGWSAAVEQGRNVVIMTTETTREQFRRKLVARHSTMPQWGLPDGINTRDLRDGTVPQQHLHTLQDIVNDLTGNQSYGNIYVAQVPRGATIATCEARLYRIQRMFNIELVIFDYFALLRSDVRRDSDRESLGAILKDAKQLTTTFDNGRGIATCSPWQVNRKAKEYADLHGVYLSEHMAETAEATNSPDIIAMILSNVDKDKRIRDVRMQLVKNREGQTVTISPFSIRLDYGTATFGRSSTTAVASALDTMVSGPAPDDLTSLIS